MDRSAAKLTELTELLDQIPQMIWKMREVESGKVELVYTNQQWNLYSSRGTVIHADFVHPSDIERTAIAWQSAVMNSTVFEVKQRLKRRDGAYRWFLTRGKLGPPGKTWYGSCTDISDLKARIELSDSVSKAALKDHDMEYETAERVRIALSEHAKVLASDVVEREQEKLIAETTRIKLSEHAKGLAFDVVEREHEKLIAETTRIKLSEHAKVLASDVVEREHEKLIAETTRIKLSEHAKVLASDVVEREHEKLIAETTRIKLSEHAKVLASDVVEREQEKLIAETTRIKLSEGAKRLEKEVLERETIRIALMENAKVLANVVVQKDLEREIAEQTRIELSENAKVLANSAVERELEMAIAERTRIALSESAKLLAIEEQEKQVGLSSEVIRRTVAEQQLKIIINSIPIILWVVDMKGTFTLSEGKGLGRIAETPGNLVSKSVFGYLPESEHTAVRQAMSGVIMSTEHNFKGREYDTYYAPLTFNAGTIGVIILSRDITEQKKLEIERSEILIREQIAVNDVQMKSNFIANMSHEIRTPLHGIMAFVEFLLETTLTEDQREYSETIYQSVEYLTVTVDDIMDISNLVKGKFQLDKVVFDPYRIIADTVSIMRPSATAKDLDLILTVSRYLPNYVDGDPNRLQQILVNLINNAIKFTKHGNIKVDASCRYRMTDENLVDFTIKVEDTGIGMSPESIGDIFSVFSQADITSTRAFGGAGLGLHISLKIARYMQGDILVTSEENVGSVFTLLVTMRKSPPPVVPTDSGNRRPLSGITVLVIEDNAINQKIVWKILSTAGATVARAENGDMGLELWKKSSSMFDIILMDCQMPVMDGYEATIHLRELGYKGPILALTANALFQNVKHCIDVGMNGTITKPIKPSSLVQYVESWTNKKERRRVRKSVVVE